MPFSRATSPLIFSYEVGGFTLPLATNHPYLGIEISFDLSWDLQIAAITKKANQILAFLRRNLGNCPVKEKEKTYFTLVRDHLEYACSAWDLHLSKHILEIENLQRRAARCVKSFYDRKHGVITNPLKEIAWTSLQRRTNARLQLV